MAFLLRSIAILLTVPDFPVKLLLMKRKIAILGATGSIGQNALKIIEIHKDRFEVFGVSAHRNIEKLKEIVEKFNRR